MTAAELHDRLADHERSARWLARELDLSATSVWRWLHGKESVPGGRVEQIERLLPRERSGSV